MRWGFLFFYNPCSPTHFHLTKISAINGLFGWLVVETCGPAQCVARVALTTDLPAPLGRRCARSPLAFQWFFITCRHLSCSTSPPASINLGASDSTLGPGLPGIQRGTRPYFPGTGLESILGEHSRPYLPMNVTGDVRFS